MAPGRGDLPEGITAGDFAQYISRIVAGQPSRDQVDRLFQHFDQDGDGRLNEVEVGEANRLLIRPANSLKSALLVVDYQNDFVTGSLKIRNGSAGQDALEALAPINELIASNCFDLIVYTQDWHPPTHISFYEHARNADRRLAREDKGRKLKPFDIVSFDQPNVQHQVLYPTHCVAGTWGADLYSKLLIAQGAIRVRKGTDVMVDSYSAFADNNRHKKSELETLLHNQGITSLFICGLAYDVCVAATIRDGVHLGFFVSIVTDCSKGLSQTAINAVDTEFDAMGVVRMQSREVIAMRNDRRLPWQWLARLADTSPSPEINGHS